MEQYALCKLKLGDNMNPKKEGFTHKGLLFGFIPVYMKFEDSEHPLLAGRNIFCDLLVNIMEPIFDIFFFVCKLLNPDFEPGYPIKITGLV